MPNRKRAAKKTARVRRYTVHFLPDVEAGGYTAHVPALGIATEGQTLAEAKAMARDAIAGYLEAAQELGKPIPKDRAGTVARVEIPA